MPFYDYECTNKHRFELKQSFSSLPVATCPVCEASAKRLILNVPVHFKGSGFYVNDYGRKDPAAAAEKKEAEGKDGKAKPVEAASKAEPKSDSKSESASATPAKAAAAAAPAAKGSEGS